LGFETLPAFWIWWLNHLYYHSKKENYVEVVEPF
jgi:hypothetical protein